MQQGDNVPRFETRPLKLQDYDNLIIVSDGILDQIGGPKHLSLGRRRLQVMIIDAVTQKGDSSVIDGAGLLDSIRVYQGDHEQRDDMTLMLLPCPHLKA